MSYKLKAVLSLPEINQPTTETCSSEESSVEAKDHTNFLIFMMTLNGLSVIVYTFGFKADYRRRRANQKS